MPSSRAANIRDAWVREYLAPRYPDLVAPYLDACAIHEGAIVSGSLDQAQLQRLLSHARSPRTPLGENVATMLGELCAGIPTLGAAIRALAAGARVHERVNALIALSSCPPTELHVELLARLLRDGSARIRILAADKVVAHGLKGLASDLAEAVQRETDVAAASELLTCLDCLNQGFHVRRDGESVWVTCRPRQGGSVIKQFAPDEYEAIGPAWISAQLSDGQSDADPIRPFA